MSLHQVHRQRATERRQSNCHMRHRIEFSCWAYHRMTTIAHHSYAMFVRPMLKKLMTNFR